MREHIIEVNTSACIGCGLCRRDCPAANIAMDHKKAVILTQSCIKCGHCVAICPKAAVSMTGFDEPPLELETQPVLDPSQLLNAIRARRTVRRFTAQPVAEEALMQITEAGRFTPTGKNAQDVSYLVLQKEMARCEKLAVRLFKRLLPLARLGDSSAKRTEIDDHFFFKKAPAALLILSNDKVNGALAASNMELMAQGLGLGVLYSGFFTLAANLSRPLRKTLGLKRGEKVVTTLVLGYPDVTYRRTAQKNPAAVRWL